MKEPIYPAGGPAPRGPYSPGVITSGRLLFVAGQLPIDPLADDVVAGDVAGQAKQALTNLLGVIDAAGASAEDIVKVNVYLADIDDAATVNSVYAAVLPQPYPARTTTQSPLPRGALIEVDAVVSLP